MKSKINSFLGLVAVVLFCAVTFFTWTRPAEAYQYLRFDIDPIPCGCRDELTQVYSKIQEKNGPVHQCVTTYEEFLKDPAHNHFWVEDPDVTSQGKADERARQFIYWVLHKNAIDDHPALGAIWNVTRNLAYFFVVILAAVLGLGFIISQRTNFDLKIKIWPAVWKILMALLYITFSAAIVILLIQLSEVLMKFFIETLGGKDLFNIYFADNSSTDRNYIDFIGCRDINIRSQEGANTEIMMLRLTNITYYVMGSMLLLRKILLWFLLFVSPFLAILFPFVFIRNVGWIWIGVFFQWLFYGPLFALFLAALARIWKSGIPFAFDFSRANRIGANSAITDLVKGGYVYPTAINILYGGPAQKLQILNNGNYIDTFVEYIITLLMLWAVTFFPWWLLRIFRDYCCEILAGMNNVLVSMYDQLRVSFPPVAPPPIPPGIITGTAKNIPMPVDQPRTSSLPEKGGRTERAIPMRLETIEEIKKAKTEQIVQSLNISATHLTDIARYETNKNMRQQIQKNISYLTNPVKADTPVERQKYMNIRTELFSRAIKEDRIARAILSSTSTSQIEQMRKKEEILKTAPLQIPVVKMISNVSQMSQERVNSVTSTYMQSMASNNSIVNSISNSTQLPAQQVQTILTSYTQNMNQPMTQIIKNISEQTHITKEKISQVLQQATNVSQQSTIMNQIASTQHINNETMQQILNTLPASHEESTTNTSSASTTTNIQNTNVNQVAQATGVSAERVTEIVRELGQTNITSKDVVHEISEKTKTSESEVQKVVTTVQQTQQATAPAQSVTKLIAYKTNISEEKASAITSSIMTSAATNNTVVSHIEKETGLTEKQVKTVLTTYSQNVSQPASVIATKINQATGLEKEKVNQVLKQAVKSVSADMTTSNQVMKDVADKQHVTQDEVHKVIDAQAPLVTEPEKHVEKTIAIPASISIEDYEEVKKMWTQQYEKGEVPVQENIASREQWVEQDIIMITNTLNKLLSADDTLRREGLDDLGFILPIFMINNLKGEELLVYLKAKLEAAKAVKDQIAKEKEILEKVKAEKTDDEELVELTDKKKEENKQELHMEMDDPDEKKDEGGLKELGDDTADAPAPDEDAKPLSNLDDEERGMNE